MGAPEPRVAEMLQVSRPSIRAASARAISPNACRSQLRERDRFDPAMRALIANLPLLARREFTTLKRLCGVDDGTSPTWCRKSRSLDPKPGRAPRWRTHPAGRADVIVRAAADGGWRRTEHRARLVNSSPMRGRRQEPGCDADRVSSLPAKRELNQKPRAPYDPQSLDGNRPPAGRALAHGVEHLRPLNLRMIADAIGIRTNRPFRGSLRISTWRPSRPAEMKYFTARSAPGGRGALRPKRSASASGR